MVLRSATTQGELARSTPLSEGKSSDELLEELLKLNQQESTGEYIPPEDRNLTEDFLKTIVDKSSGATINPQQIASDDFFVSAILPYLKANQINLFPDIPDSAVKTVADSKINFPKYFRDTNNNVVALFKAIDKLLKTDPEKIEEQEIQDGLRTIIFELSDVFENLARVSVPPKYLELHKNVLLTSFSAHKMAEAMKNGADDPLKSLLIFNETEAVGEFWKETLTKYNQASKKP